MRSAKEILYRVRQETANLRMLVFPAPEPEAFTPSPLEGLPDPGRIAGRLRGTGYARELEGFAERILQHDFPILGTEVRTGPEIRWRRDWVNGVETGKDYFRRIPYLDFQRAGDHKIVWELNRHQHLVVLAQAFRLSGRTCFVEEIQRQVESWMEDNPWLRGINWASALEVAFRALSWFWTYHLAGDAMPPPFRKRLLKGLHRHGSYLEHNLSVYFSPNTHLLGEAVALHALGALFPAFPEAQRWRELGGSVVREQMRVQVRPDGSHFEQSTYYHVYALDFFLLHAAISETTAEYRDGLARMAEYLSAVMGPSRSLPFFGDDDGGRVFHPYGPRNRFGRATLASCGVLLGRPEWIACRSDLFEQAAWWFGEQNSTCEIGEAVFESRLFPDAGMAVMEGGGLRLTADAGPFGPWAGGHSHSDTLHFIASDDHERVLIDPGTYAYIGDEGWRERFRGSAAHNTVRIDGADQASPAGPFAWRGRPRPEILAWESRGPHDYLDAICRMGKLWHRRRILLVKPSLAIVLDEIGGPGGGPHLVEQFWHCGEPARMIAPDRARIGTRGVLSLSLPGELSEGGLYGWVSPVLGTKHSGPVIRVECRGSFPLRLAAMLELSPAAEGSIAFEGATRLRFRASSGEGVANFGEGPPQY